MKKKQKREEKLARRAEKKARWESLIADLDQMKKENVRLSFKLEQLRSVIALPTCASSEILHDVTTILNDEAPHESESEDEKREREDDLIEKEVAAWDDHRLVEFFWEFVRDQGIESDFMDYAREEARYQLDL